MVNITAMTPQKWAWSDLDFLGPTIPDGLGFGLINASGLPTFLFLKQQAGSVLFLPYHTSRYAETAGFASRRTRS
jgi:hypothetical protein